MRLEQSEESWKRLGDAIGSFILRFELLERTIDLAIAKLIPLTSNPLVDLLLGPITSIDTRLDILQSLVSGVKMEKAIRNDLLDIVAEVRECNVFRNWIVHGRWGAWLHSDDKWQKVRPKTKRKFSYVSWEIGSTDIIAEEAKCRNLVVRLSATMEAYAP